MSADRRSSRRRASSEDLSLEVSYGGPKYMSDISTPEFPATYQKRKFELVTVAGQNASLRRLDLRHLPDLQRLWTIEKSEGYEKYMQQISPYKTVEEMKSDMAPSNPKRKGNESLEWLKKMCDEREGVMYAVAKRPRPEEKIDPEWGELQGWIYVYESTYTDQELKNAGVTRKSNQPVMEVSYIKVPDRESGIMKSGIASVLHDISRMNAQSDAKSGKDKVEPTVSVTATIEPGNASSIKIGESLGFVKRGQVKAEKTVRDGNATKEVAYDTDLYELDWKKFDGYLKEASAKELGLNYTPLEV